MPDFAPNMTPRYVLTYRAVGRLHNVLTRATRGTTFVNMEGQGQQIFNAWFAAMAPLLVDDLAFISAAVALTDSDLFFPAAVPTAVVGAQLISLYSKQDSITHLTFSGRGAGGSKVSYKMYGVTTNPDQLPANTGSDFILTSAEDPRVAAAVAALNTEPDVRAIDNTRPVFRAQATIKVNDKWLRKVRQGL